MSSPDLFSVLAFFRHVFTVEARRMEMQSTDTAYEKIAWQCDARRAQWRKIEDERRAWRSRRDGAAQSRLLSLSFSPAILL